jgi:hypothetical protein
MQSTRVMEETVRITVSKLLYVLNIFVRVPEYIKPSG